METTIAYDDLTKEPLKSASGPTNEPLQSTADLAVLFQVDAKTVATWARDGLIPSLRTPGGQYRFRPADVRALLASDSVAEAC